MSSAPPLTRAKTTKTLSQHRRTLDHTASAITEHILRRYREDFKKRGLNYRNFIPLDDEVLIRQDLRSIALQYLTLNLDLAKVVYYTFQVSRVKNRYLRRAYDQALLETSQVRPGATPHTPEQIESLEDIKASSKAVNQDLKHQSKSLESIQQTIGDLLFTDPKTDIPTERQAIAKRVTDTVQLAAALNTNPKTAVISAIQVALPEKYQNQAPRIAKKLKPDLQRLYTLSQEILINSSESGWYLTANLNHQLHPNQLEPLLDLSQQHQVSPLSLALSLVMTQSELADRQKTHQVLHSFEDFPQAYSTFQQIYLEVKQLQTTGITPLSTNQLSAWFNSPATAEAATAAAGVEGATAAAAINPYAALLVVAAPLLKDLEEKIKRKTKRILTAAALAAGGFFAGLGFLALKFAGIIKSAATTLAGGVLGGLTGFILGGPIGGLIGAPLGAIILPNLGSILGTISAVLPSIASGSIALIQAFLGTLASAVIGNVFLSVLIIVIITPITAFIINAADLSAFIQNLDQEGQRLTPPTITHCQPSLNPFGSEPYRMTDGYRNNGSNCRRNQGGHPAVDLSSRSDFIHSTFACTTEVVYAGDDPFFAFGKYVVLKSGDWYAFYTHLSDLRVATGTRIESGEIIGIEGQTGNAKGEHLHYEIRRASSSEPVYPTDNCQVNVTINPCDYGIQGSFCHQTGPQP